MKIGIISDSPTVNSGYGEIGKNLLYYLDQQGYDTFSIGLQHRGYPVAVPIKDKYFRMYSGFVYINGINYTINKAIEIEKPDVLITVRDWVTFHPPGFGQAFKLSQYKGRIKRIGYIPLMEPYVNPDMRASIVENSDITVGYTEYEKQMLINEGIPYNQVEAINVGFDPDVYKPSKPLIEIPHELSQHKIFGFVGLLTDKRKMLGSLMKAFSYYLKSDDKAMLYIHNNLVGHQYQILQMADALRIRQHLMIPQHNGAFDWAPEWYYSDHEMARLFSSFTAGVSMSAQEGFNMPFMEQLACGTPVLGVDSPFYDWSDQIMKVKSHETELNTGYGYVSDPREFAEAMHHVVNKKVDRKKLKDLEWQNVIKKWVKVIEGA